MIMFAQLNNIFTAKNEIEITQNVGKLAGRKKIA